MRSARTPLTPVRGLNARSSESIWTFLTINAGISLEVTICGAPGDGPEASSVVLASATKARLVQILFIPSETIPLSKSLNLRGIFGVLPLKKT